MSKELRGWNRSSWLHCRGGGHAGRAERAFISHTNRPALPLGREVATAGAGEAGGARSRGEVAGAVPRVAGAGTVRERDQGWSGGATEDRARCRAGLPPGAASIAGEVRDDAGSLPGQQRRRERDPSAQAWSEKLALHRTSGRWPTPGQPLHAGGELPPGRCRHRGVPDRSGHASTCAFNPPAR